MTKLNYTLYNLQILIDQWKIGEKSRLFYAARQAFGAEGYPDLGIPPNKDVTYVLEMKNYERVCINKK